MRDNANPNSDPRLQQPPKLDYRSVRPESSWLREVHKISAGLGCALYVGATVAWVVTAGLLNTSFARLLWVWLTMTALIIALGIARVVRRREAELLIGTLIGLCIIVGLLGLLFTMCGPFWKFVK
jgi:hypothetical protein